MKEENGGGKGEEVACKKSEILSQGNPDEGFEHSFIGHYLFA
jgi:hypothetical protein